jgi:hypothetical protein
MSSEPKSEKPESKQDPKPQVEIKQYNLLKPTNEDKLPKKPELTILNKAKKMSETLNSPEKARNTSASKTVSASIKNEDQNGLMAPDEEEDNQDQDMALPE